MPAVGSGRRAQRSRSLVAASGLDPEELLLDDVGDLADAALEHLGLLEEGRLDGLVAVVGGQVAGEALEAAGTRPARRAGGHACRAASGRRASAESSRAAWAADRPAAQPWSRWTEYTSLSCSRRDITRDSCATEATSSVAWTIARWSGCVATLAATMLILSRRRRC